MQAQVIHGGSPTTFNLLVYPEQSSSIQQYIQHQLQTFSSQVSGAVNSYAQTFVDRAKELYGQYNNSAVIQAARATLRAASAVFHPNSIVMFDSIESLQAASPLMQRYLMADPVVRQYYFDQRIDGYSDTYKNLHGKVSGDQHYDFRRVTDGVVFTEQEYAELHGKDYDENDSQYGWISVSYSEDMLGGDRELKTFEQHDILSDWQLQRAFLKKLQDPTNPYGGDVGA